MCCSTAAAGAVAFLLSLSCQTLFHAQTDARVSKSWVSWTQRTGVIAACNMQMRWVLVYSRSVAFFVFLSILYICCYRKTRKSIDRFWSYEKVHLHRRLKIRDSRLLHHLQKKIRINSPRSLTSGLESIGEQKNTNTWYFWAITQDSVFGRSWVIKEIRSAGDSG